MAVELGGQHRGQAPRWQVVCWGSQGRPWTRQWSPGLLDGRLGQWTEERGGCDCACGDSVLGLPCLSVKPGISSGHQNYHSFLQPVPWQVQLCKWACSQALSFLPTLPRISVQRLTLFILPTASVRLTWLFPFLRRGKWGTEMKELTKGHPASKRQSQLWIQAYLTPKPFS